MEVIDSLAQQLPDRLRQALKSLAQLNELGITLLPVRHHSPACAYTTKRALDKLQPDNILIEAPASFNELLSDLQHLDNKPPLAVLCQTQVVYVSDNSVDGKSIDGDEEKVEQSEGLVKNDEDSQPKKRLYSAYFPFCEYSPEWVALRYYSNNSPSNRPYIGCIDLPWSEQVLHRENMRSEQTYTTQSLQQERYLAHNNYIKALANKLHCRDHDEVWEHLFELDGISQLNDWRAFFHKVLVWCAMSRLDYEQDVLERESSLIREQHMVERILERYEIAKTNLQKPINIVVVTGGFHTLALIELLHDALFNKAEKPKTKRKSTAKKPAKNTMTSSSDESWLIRYSFDRLDALNGYASGMPSPAFYQACWEQMLAQSSNQNASQTDNQFNSQIKSHDSNQNQARQSLVINFLSEFSRELRHEQIIQSSYITVKTASEQAIRLAQLREHKLIGRFDVMDACYSSFLKGSRDDGYHSFHDLLKSKLGGSRLGQVVSTSRTPPLLAQVYGLIKSNRFKLDDTLSKTAKLDVLRKPSHRLRSCLLHLLAFLDVGFARRISGPDFLHGGQLHLLFEEWLYAWTPQIEARLIELSEEGADIYQLATQRLLAQRYSYAEQAQNQSSAQVITLLIQASMMGLNEQIDILFDKMSQILPQDPDLGSVLACGQHLLYLWTGKAFLQLQKDEPLIDLLAQVPVSALFLLAQLQTPNTDQVADTLNQILSLRSLLKQLDVIVGSHDFDEHKINEATLKNNWLSEYHLALQRLLPSWQAIDLLLGAVHALEFIDDISAEDELARRLQLHFGTGANAEQAVAYLSGMMQAVPTIFLHHQGITKMLDSLISAWDNATFIALLPDLRLAFTGLKPMQTNEFSQQIATLHNVSSTEITQFQGQISERDMLQGVALNQQLDKVLGARRLKDWLGVNA